MIEIDGGEGGGQLLRSALSLSALTGEPFRITDIRGGRPNPGLRSQQLRAVEVVAEVCDAEMSAVDLGVESLTFRPGAVQSGTYTVDIGTAGSVMLLFDTMLPLAVTTSKPLVLAATGGTDVKWSPTAAHYCQVKLRLLRRFGLQAIVELDRPGFYPVGGGEATLRIGPTQLSPLALSARDGPPDGDFFGARVFSLSSVDLADDAVASRQMEAALEGLKKADVPVLERTVRYAAADSPGSSVTIRLEWAETFAGFDAVGEPGKSAEAVAAEAVEDATTFIRDTTAAVDRHTADQLLVFLALAGGRVAVPEITDHIATNRELLSAFGFDVGIEQSGETSVLTADESSEPRFTHR